MKVLAVGGGGREHAAVEALHRSGAEIYAVMKNANPGIIARSAGYRLCDEKRVDEVVAFAKECGAELAFIGPEAPLEVGLVDALQAAGIRCASPTKAAARIETSKSFMRGLVEKHGINGHLRQKGKIAELALGYGGSVGALKAMGALEMGIPEEELKTQLREEIEKVVIDACLTKLQSEAISR